MPKRKPDIEYRFLIGVELFSRYAFIKWYRVGKDIKEEQLMVLGDKVVETDPVVEQEAQEQEIDQNDEIKGLKSKQVIEACKDWFKDIKDDLKYDLQNFVSDEGPEFRAADFAEFLQKGGNGIFDHEIGQGFAVPNDRVKNPIAERMIGTFKRLFGQYCAINKTDDIGPKQAQKIIDFYNNRIHSSTGYTPEEVLRNQNYENHTLFEIYRYQKGAMYDDLQVPLEKGYCRISTKWKTPDKNFGDVKSNINNWSYTIYKIEEFNRADNHYIVKPVDGKIDPRDKKLVQPGKKGLRRELIRPLDYEAFKRYN